MEERDDNVGEEGKEEVEELDARVRLSKGLVHYRLTYPKRHRSALPLVICVHGIDHVARVWDFLARHLASHTEHALLSFDLYERGGSKLDDPSLRHTGELFVEQLHELWEKIASSAVEEEKDVLQFPPLNNDSFALIGHSMGGAVSLLFAHQYPDLVNKLVLIGSAGMKFSVPAEMQLMRLPGLGSRLFQWFAKQEDMMKEDFMDLEASKDAIAHVMEHTKGMYGSHEFANAFVNSFKNFPLRDLENVILEVGKHKRPSLVMWGEHDNLISREQWLPRFEEAFGVGSTPLHQSHIIRNTKHSAFLERIEEANQVIADFLTAEEDNSGSLNLCRL